MMKKLMVLTLVLGIASLASAALTYDVAPDDDPLNVCSYTLTISRSGGSGFGGMSGPSVIEIS